MLITLFDRLADKSPGHRLDLTWSELCDELLSKHTQVSKKDLSKAFIFGTFKDNRRLNDNAEYFHGLILEVDKELTPQYAKQVLDDLGYSYAIFTTWSYDKLKAPWKFRVVVPFDSELDLRDPVDRSAYDASWDWLNTCLSNCGDPSGKRPAQGQYLPSHIFGGEGCVYTRKDGARISVEMLRQIGSARVSRLAQILKNKELQSTMRKARLASSAPARRSVQDLAEEFVDMSELLEKFGYTPAQQGRFHHPETNDFRDVGQVVLVSDGSKAITYSSKDPMYQFLEANGLKGTTSTAVFSPYDLFLWKHNMDRKAAGKALFHYICTETPYRDVIERSSAQQS